jgi:hypothetical protein
MKNVFSLRKRSFLSPVSTGFTSHIFAEVESSNEGEYRWGHNMLTIADCRRRVQIEFFLGTKRERRRSLAKINLLIAILTRFRDALTKEDQFNRDGQSQIGSEKTIAGQLAAKLSFRGGREVSWTAILLCEKKEITNAND